MKKEIIIGLHIFLIGFLIGFFIYGIVTYEDSYEPKQTIKELECKGLGLINTSKCLVNNVNQFYSYTDTDDKINLTEEELKEKGGDCNNWANYYVKKFKELGFYGNIAIFDIDKETSHVVAIISNEKGYCVIDQTEIIGCQKLN